MERGQKLINCEKIYERVKPYPPSYYHSPPRIGIDEPYSLYIYIVERRKGRKMAVTKGAKSNATQRAIHKSCPRKKNEKKGGDGRSKGGKCTEVARVIACINHAEARQRKTLLPS